jgi:LemA protein
MGWIAMALFAFAVVGSVLYVVGIYNALVNLKHGVDRAWANIDVLLKQRHDEIPKLVDTVKGYVKHEREVLQRVTEARAALEQARSVAEKGQADARLHDALGRLFAVAESYPELKADTSFQMLQQRVSGLEDGIADRREFFNHSVNAHNVRIEQIPDVVIANLMGLRPRELFEAPAAERADVRISFES